MEENRESITLHERQLSFDPQTPSIYKKYKILGLVSLLFILILLGAGYVFISLKRPYTPPVPILSDIPVTPSRSIATGVIDTSHTFYSFPPISGNYTISIADNPTDKEKSDIYLIDTTTKKQTHVLTVGMLEKNRVHTAEYDNGSIYLLHRYGSETDLEWRNELWKYTQDQKAVKVTDGKGIDFLVAADEQYIATKIANKIIILDSSGREITSISARDIMLEDEYNAEFQGFSADTLWLSLHEGPKVMEMIQIKVTTNAIKKYDLNNLNLYVGDFAFNPNNQLIMYSSFPIFFDAESYKTFVASKEKVSLYTYNLNKKEKKEITTSQGKEFKPTWVGGSTFEFNNPLTDTRTQADF